MTDAKVCGVCGDTEDPTPVVLCINCLTPFHLRLRKDQPGKDCGDAVLGESMGVEMICNNCIEQLRAGPQAGDALSMFMTLTEGQLAPPAVTQPPSRPSPPPAAPLTAPLRPARPAPEPEDGRPRRRFRRVDR